MPTKARAGWSASRRWLPAPCARSSFDWSSHSHPYSSGGKRHLPARGGLAYNVTRCLVENLGIVTTSLQLTVTRAQSCRPVHGPGGRVAYAVALVLVSLPWSVGTARADNDPAVLDAPPGLPSAIDIR